MKGKSKSKRSQPKGIVKENWIRNLRKDKLAAVIFGCKDHTITECLKDGIFGLPEAHFSYVKNINPGLKLFLFNYSDRKLHGIFEATTHGRMNICPYAWITSEGAMRTPYAAQVRFEVRMRCRPLLEKEFKQIIAENYYAENLFWFELDNEQAGRLTKLFLSSPFTEKIPSADNTANWNCTLDPLPGPELVGANDDPKENHELSYGSVLTGSNTFAPGKKWTELFKTCPSSSAVKNGEGVKSESASLEVEFAKLPLSSKPFHEASPGTLIEECDPLVPISWEGLADLDYHVEETYKDEVSCNERESDASCMTHTSSPKDKTLLLVNESEETHLHSLIHDGNFQIAEPNLINQDNSCPTFGGVNVDSYFESVVIELMTEIEELNNCNMNQRVKIDSLEHDLVNSKLVIDLLKKRCNNELEYMPSSDRDPCNRDDSESSNFLCEEAGFVVGGFDGSSWLPALNSYSPSRDHVTSLCPMSFPRSHASVAKLNGELYIYGGIHEGIFYDTVESYNPVSNWWFQRPSLNHKRGSLAGTSMYEKLYAIGGGSSGECFSDVELLDLNFGRWVFTQPMLEKRFASAAANLNGALYVAGGFDGRSYLSSVERFDPRQHAWTSTASMRMKRSCHCLVALNEKLYALGGYDGDKVVSSVEVYDPRRGFWTPEEPMMVPRRHFGSFVFGGKIYAICGMNENRVLDVVECYEEGYGWRMAGPSSLGKRCSFSSLIM